MKDPSLGGVAVLFPPPQEERTKVSRRIFKKLESSMALAFY